MSAAQRVQEFCDSHDDWEGEQDYVIQTGEYGADDRVTLSKADLRELLATITFYEMRISGLHD